MPGDINEERSDPVWAGRRVPAGLVVLLGLTGAVALTVCVLSIRY